MTKWDIHQRIFVNTSVDRTLDQLRLVAKDTNEGKLIKFPSCLPFAPYDIGEVIVRFEEGNDPEGLGHAWRLEWKASQKVAFNGWLNVRIDDSRKAILNLRGSCAIMEKWPSNGFDYMLEVRVVSAIAKQVLFAIRDHAEL